LDDDVDAALLKRRARRRLVGAVALVVFVDIALPIVLDREPKPISQDLTIQIPSQDGTKFNTKVLPPEDGAKDGAGAAKAAPTQVPSATTSTSAAPTMPAAPAAGIGGGATGDASKAAVVAQTAPATLPEPKAETKPPEANTKTEAAPAARTKAEGKPVAKPVETAKAAESKTTAESEIFFVPLGTYVKQENVRQVQSKVTTAGFKSYSEKLASGQIRLRAGPFNSRDAAENARNKLKSSGVDVGAVGSAAKG